MATPPSTRDKALTLNLDGTSHGRFAEIGAGQEVSRWFSSVGGAAGTVAKTIEDYLSIRTSDVLARIQRGDPSWTTMVPPAVAAAIKDKTLFGCEGGHR